MAFLFTLTVVLAVVVCLGTHHVTAGLLILTGYYVFVVMVGMWQDRATR